MIPPSADINLFPLRCRRTFCPSGLSQLKWGTLQQTSPLNFCMATYNDDHFPCTHTVHVRMRVQSATSHITFLTLYVHAASTRIRHAYCQHTLIVKL